MNQPQAVATGELKDTPFGGLLFSILSRQLTGSLVVAETPECRHCVSFREGFPIKARLDDPIDLMGEILIEAGSLDPVQLPEILEYSQQLGLLSGEAAIMLGYTETDALNQALVVQTARRVARLFAFHEGTYGFYQEDFLASFGGDDNPHVDPLAIIAAGVRSSYDLGRLISLLQGVQTQPIGLMAPPELIGRFRFTESEAAVAAGLETKRTLADLMTSSGQPQTTVYGVVHCLHTTGLLDLGQVADSMPPPPVQIPHEPSPPQPVSSQAPPPPSPSASVQPSPPAQPSQAPPVRSSSPAVQSSPPVSPAVQSSPPPQRPAPSSTPSSSAQALSSQSEPMFPPTDEPKSERRVEAEELISKGDKATYFELLGITREASSADVQKAWASRAKQFHPDKATGDLSDLRAHLEQLMARITVAKDTLKDSEQRKDYLASLDLSFDGKLKGPTSQGRAPSHEDNLVRQALEAEEAFIKSKILLKRSQFKEAEEYAEIACKSDKENGDYMALLAWIESRQRNRKDNHDDLLQRLREAVKLAPRSEDAHFYFAQLLYQMGRLRKALSEFEETMDLNPDNIDAVRMVRILRKKKAEAIKKRKEQKSGGGILASLFGDKKR